jgi:hypothetical protein
MQQNENIEGNNTVNSYFKATNVSNQWSKLLPYKTYSKQEWKWQR